MGSTTTSKSRKIARLRKYGVGYLYLSPSIIWLIVFTLFPVVASLFLSLTQWDLLNPPKFIGVRNYLELGSDAEFWKTFRNTGYYVGGTVPLDIVLALILAIALNQKIRGVSIFRAVYFLPVISTWVAVSVVWRWIYNYEFGLLNAFLGIFKIPSVDWLGNTKWAMFSVILISVWKNVGYSMIIFLAGLQGIPTEYYEAAMVDGAGRWRLFRHITLPLLTPSIFFVMITAVINSFQVFGPIYIMTAGGPLGSTSVLIYYLFENAFLWYKMGYGSAIAWVLFAVIFIFTAIQVTTSRRWVHYGI